MREMEEDTAGRPIEHQLRYRERRDPTDDPRLGTWIVECSCGWGTSKSTWLKRKDAVSQADAVLREKGKVHLSEAENPVIPVVYDELGDAVDHDDWGRPIRHQLRYGEYKDPYHNQQLLGQWSVKCSCPWSVAQARCSAGSPTDPVLLLATPHVVADAPRVATRECTRGASRSGATSPGRAADPPDLPRARSPVADGWRPARRLHGDARRATHPWRASTASRAQAVRLGSDLGMERSEGSQPQM
jgi:hypothetical protein